MAQETNFEWRLRFVAVGVVVVYWGAMFAGTHLNLPVLEQPHAPDDKTMHIVAYTGLVFLWLVAAAAFGRVSWLMYIIVMIGAGAYGAVDEISQGLVGRNTDVADWRFDMLGAALGSIAFAAVHAAWNLWRPAKEAG